MNFFTSSANAHHLLFLSLFLIRMIGGFSVTWKSKSTSHVDARSIEYLNVKYFQSSKWKLWSYFFSLAMLSYILFALTTFIMPGKLTDKSATFTFLENSHSLMEVCILAYLSLSAIMKNSHLLMLAKMLNNIGIHRYHTKSVAITHLHKSALIFVLSNVSMILIFCTFLYWKFNILILQETINVTAYLMMKLPFLLFYLETCNLIHRVYAPIVKDVTLINIWMDKEKRIRSTEAITATLRSAKTSILKTYPIRISLQKYIGRPVMLTLVQALFTALIGAYHLAFNVLDPDMNTFYVYLNIFFYCLMHTSFFIVMIYIPSLILGQVSIHLRIFLTILFCLYMKFFIR